MTFVNEKISDEDRERFNIDTRYLSWMADHERGAFLLSRGGGSDPHLRSFILYWGGHSTKISAEEYAQGNPEIGITIDYKINRVDVPDALQPEKIEIYRLLEEALNEYGITGRRLPNSRMTITYSSGRA